MQFVGIPHVRPCLRRDLVDGRLVQRPHAGRQVHVHAAERHRPRPSLFQRGVIQERVRVGIQDLVRHWRWDGRIHGYCPKLPPLETPDEDTQSFDIHGLVKAVLHGLVDQGVIGRRDRTRIVVLAGHLLREDGSQQIVGLHPLERHRDPPAATRAKQGQRPGRVPAPARAEHGSLEDGLDQILVQAAGADHGEHALQREAVLLSQRDHDPVIRGRRLELEVEGQAEALSQCESPRPGDPGAEGRMQDELHPARLVEEAFGHDRLQRRHRSQDCEGLGHVRDDLLGGRRIRAAFGAEPCDGRADVRQAARHRLSDVGHRCRQRYRPPGRLAQPEGDGRRGALGILDPDLP